MSESTPLKTLIDRKPQIKAFCARVKDLMNADQVHIRTIDWLQKKLILEGVCPETIENDFPLYRTIPSENAIGGFVFISKEPVVADNIMENSDFCTYIEMQQDEKYQKFLRSFKSAIVVPVFFQDKAIGVLTAIWMNSASFLPENSEKIKKEMVRHASDASAQIYNNWLWDTITWEPSKQNITLDNLGSSVEDEVKRKTGANAVQVRLLNWEEKFSVPTLPGMCHLLPEMHDLTILTVCELCQHDENACPECLVTRTKSNSSLLIKDLEIDDNYGKFKLSAETRKHFISKLLEGLNQCLEKINDNSLSDESIRTFFEQKCNDSIEIWDKNKEITRKRFKLPKTLDKEEVKKSLKRQISVLRDLDNAWNCYLNDLKKWQSELVVGIHHGNRLLGIMSAYSTEKNWFCNIDETILQTLANRIADIIVEHQLRLVEDMLKIGHYMATERSYSKIRNKLLYEKIKKEAAHFQLKGEEDIYFILYTCQSPTSWRTLAKQPKFEDNFKYQPRQGASEFENKLGGDIRGQGLGFKAINKLRGKSPVFIVCDNVVDPIRGGSETAYILGIKSTVCIPLASEEMVYGLLYIHSKKMRFFTKIERDAFLLFAQQATTLLKMHTFGSDELYDTVLIDMASKSMSDDLPDYLRKFCSVFENSDLKECTMTDAASGVKDIVNSLISVAGLPSSIGTRYIDFCNEEGLLYHDKKYRDHFFHTFHTFLMGFEILKKLTICEKQSGGNNLSTSMPFKIDATLLNKWLLTSLWHDIAYAAEKGPLWLNGYINKILKIDIKYSSNWGGLFVEEENISIINDMIKTIFSVTMEKLETFQTWFYRQISTLGDHAILSALLLKKECKGLISEEHLNECAISIALHNLHKTHLYKTKDDSLVKKIGVLDINKFPLAYLLSYCDTAQEWGRLSHNDPAEYTKFADVKISGERKTISILLDKDLNEYCKILKANGKPHTAKDAECIIADKWRSQVDALAHTWLSHEWQFLIELDTSDGIGDHQRLVCHKRLSTDNV